MGDGVGDGVGVCVGVGATTIGNFDTFIVTIVPFKEMASANGFCAITIFSATVPFSSNTTSTKKPAFKRVFLASV